MNSKEKKKLKKMTQQELQDYIAENPPELQIGEHGDNHLDIRMSSDAQFILALLFDHHHGDTLLEDLPAELLKFVYKESKDCLTEATKATIIVGDALKESMKALGPEEKKEEDK